MRTTSTPLLAIFLLALGSRSTFAQDLVLDVNRVDNPKKIELTFRDTALKPNDPKQEIKPDSPNWNFKVISHGNSFTVKISKTPIGPEGIKTLSFDEASKDSTMAVVNNTITNLALPLIAPTTLTIKVIDKNGQTLGNYTPQYVGPIKSTDQSRKIISTAGYAVGSVVYDAFFLADPNKDAKAKSGILAAYAGLKTDAKLEDIQARIGDNKLFTELYADITSVPQAADAQGLGILGGISKAVANSALGATPVTAFVDGASRFVVKRTRQELSISFFQKFKELIDKHENRDLKTVFPRTHGLLLIIDDEIYNYERYIQNLRSAFQDDVKLLNVNLPGIIDNHPDFFKDKQALAGSLRSGCYTAKAIDDHTHPGDVIADYPIEYLDGFRNKNIVGAFQTLQLVSASLRDTASSDQAAYWVNTKRIRDLANNRKIFKIYLGLLSLEAQTKFGGVDFEKGKLIDFLKQLGDSFDTNYEGYKRYIIGFGEKANAITRLVKDHDKAATDSIRLQVYVKYVRTAVEMLEYMTEASRLPFVSTDIGDLHKPLATYFDLVYSATDLVSAIQQKNYPSAINHVVHIYHSTLVLTADSARKPLKLLTKYGSFIASVAVAKNSDEVNDAIETFALPVGSSRIKRESGFNVSLNAYLGAFGGWERIQDLDNVGSRKGKPVLNSFGVSAPIGVAASIGQRRFFWLGNSRQSHWSYSLFLSLVDIGAVAAFRFKDPVTTSTTGTKASNDTLTAQLPTIQLKDIISPGAFLSIGIPKSPVSINLGVQAGPNLRKVYRKEGTATSNMAELNYSDNVYLRYSISICVDIPVLNFYTKSDRNKIDR